jgi:hypothetical protein
MSTDPRRITDDGSIGELFGRVRALERAFHADGLPFATIRNFGGALSLPDHALHYFDLVGGSTAIFDTNDPDIFQNGVTSAITGSPLHGIESLAAGSYAILLNGDLTGGTPGAQGIIYHTDIAAGSGFLSTFLLGRNQLALGDNWDAGLTNHIFSIEFEGFPTDADAPCVYIPQAQVLSGAAASANVQMIIIQLSPYGSSAF